MDIFESEGDGDTLSGALRELEKGVQEIFEGFVSSQNIQFLQMDY